MEYFDREAVVKLNDLTQKAIAQINEAIKIAEVPVSVTGAGSMFRLHLQATPPTTYREAYQSKDVAALIREMLDHLFFEENVMMVNTMSCMLSTVMTQKEIDVLSNAMLNMFRRFKPQLHQIQN